MVSAWLLEHEASVRLAFFVSLFVLLGIAQWRWPRRRDPMPASRSLTNLALVVIDTLALRLLLPLLAFDLAIQMQHADSGVLNQLPTAAGLLVGLLILDLSIYWQHRLFHVVPFLWRLHRVHHADVTLDVTTAVRFHPFEIVLSMVIKLGVIAALGVPPLAVLVFEILLNAGALFTHSNLGLRGTLDKRLRWLLVTPDMHRIHHSVHEDESNQNFGFHLTLWDRLFGSYRDEPRDGHTTMQIGLTQFRDERSQTLWGLLSNPFRTGR
ncbi:MAG: sterol desaturase family protein [Gammaproteobacteria bacterium]